MIEFNGVELISIERQRQVSVEGHTPEQDDQHTNSEIPLAAACYILDVVEKAIPDGSGYYSHALTWPWNIKWWKPTPDDPIRQLTKAGALIAAEIDRLHRKAELDAH